MSLLLSLGVATLFGCGAYLMLKHDLLRMAIGVILISNAANLFLISMALTRGAAPIYPLPPGVAISDPVVQALTLTGHRAALLSTPACAQGQQAGRLPAAGAVQPAGGSWPR